MAARMLQIRRVLSLFTLTNPPSSLLKEPSLQFLPSANVLCNKNEFYRRGIQTLTSPTTPANEDSENHKSGDSANVSTQVNSHEYSAVKHTALSNLIVSSRHDTVMIFTCKVCETRSVKTVCRESYEKGVVVARCGGCNNLHLIADRLGWFGEPGSVEDYLAARGEEVKKGSADTLNLTLQDLAGQKTLQE